TEAFSYGAVFAETKLFVIYIACEYLAFLFLYMCAIDERTGLKLNFLIKYFVIPLALTPLVLSFIFGFFYFEAASFIFLWIPATAIIFYGLYRISKMPSGQEHVPIILALFAGYAIGFCFIEALKIFHPNQFQLQAFAQGFIALNVFAVAAVSFRHFKSLYEQKIKIYDFIPFYWKHIPLASILFIILISGVFVSFYFEVKVKKSVAENADSVVSGLSETLLSRLSKTDQISEALAKSVFIAESVSPSFKGDRSLVDKVLENYRNIFKVSSIFILDKYGDIIYASDYKYEKELKRVNLKNSPLFYETQTKGRSRVFTKNVPGENGESYYASTKINNSDGVIVVKNSIDNYDEMLLKYDNIYIIDKNGIILFSNENDVCFKSLWSLYETADKTKKRKVTADEIFNEAVVMLQNKPFYVSKKIINDDFWSVVYFNSLDPVRQTRALSLFGISGFIVIVLLSFLIINQSNRLIALSRRQNAILDSVRSVAILSTDVNGKITMWGQGAMDLAGYSMEEISAKEFRDVLFDKNGFSMSFSDTIERRGIVFSDLMFKKKDGTMANILLNVVPQFSSVGKLIGYIFSAIDITYRKNIETEIEQQIKFLQTLIDSMPIAVFYKDSFMHIIGCNKAFEEISGFSKDEVIGKKSEDIYFDMEAAKMSKKTDEEIVENMSAISYEIVVKGPDHVPKIFLYYKSVYKKLNGEFGGIIGVVIDITKERAVQKERDMLQTSLVQQNKLASLGELAGSIAHELNNPLSIILGYAQVLAKNKDLNEEMRKGIKNIYEAADRSRSIISNMLEFSRADSSKMQNVDLDKVVDSTLPIIEKDLKKAGIEVEKNFTEKDKLVSINPMQIQQVLLNVILNARDAMPGGGKLTITSYVKNDKYCLDISDTGEGIPKKN
ncbi:MAG: PAS domain S-box protein, partial [Endomicrobia bacterium]|nr:PAS domain S-box protein [Endomicrobiia bacterium]